jgi:hypothetical protein
MEKLTEDQRISRLSRIEKLSADLQYLESKLSAEEKATQPIETPLPCYFNTGCCSFADGDITGIEISAGEIRLVRWPDDEGQATPKVLESSKLKEIFTTLKQ